MKIGCITILILFSVCCRAQTLVSEENDSTVITEYNDGKLWVYRNVDNFIVGIRVIGESCSCSACSFR